MPDNTPALVVVAAGGLGTRVHGWAQFIPKEFYPVGGRPGIVRLLEEIADLGPARVIVVYHPYYEQFAAWGRQVLGSDGHDRYARQAGLDIPAAIPPGVTVSLIPQRGVYGDLTSVVNGADCLATTGSLYVAFADNLYTGHGPASVAALRTRRRCRRACQQLPPGPRAQPGHPDHQRRDGRRTAAGESADRETGPGAGQGTGRRVRNREPAHAGRPRPADRAVSPVRPCRQLAAPGSEPKLSLAIGAYARDHRVTAVPALGDVIDLGTPELQFPADTERAAVAATSRTCLQC